MTDGQSRAQLRRIAARALAEYAVTSTRLTFVGESFNTVFRVTADTESVFALRIGPPMRIHAEGTEAAEQAWQERLRRHGLTTPRILTTNDGAPSTTVDGRRCVLMGWIHGRKLRRPMSTAAAHELGRLSARLHSDAAGWAVGDDLDVLRGDRVLYWRLPPHVITATEPSYGSLFAEALTRAQSDLDRMWRDPPHRPHVVHGDLTPENVIDVPGQGLVPIDFQDMIVGFDIQDIAITIAALRRRPDARRVIEAFRVGYGEIRVWPETTRPEFESLIVARLLNQMNLTLPRVPPGELDDYLSPRAAAVREWLNSRLPGGFGGGVAVQERVDVSRVDAGERPGR